MMRANFAGFERARISAVPFRVAKGVGFSPLGRGLSGLRILASVLLLLCTAALAQSERRKPAQPATTRAECSTQAEFCVTVPATWKRLGDDFDGDGFVVAEPRTGATQDQWNLLTAAARDIPEPQAGKEPMSLDEFISDSLMMLSQHAQINTMERRRLEIAGHPAQVLRVAYDDPDGKRVLELLGFIDGEDGAFYMLSLRIRPEDEQRMTAVFDRIVHSWRSTAKPSAK